MKVNCRQVKNTFLELESEADVDNEIAVRMTSHEEELIMWLKKEDVQILIDHFNQIKWK